MPAEGDCGQEFSWPEEGLWVCCSDKEKVCFGVEERLGLNLLGVLAYDGFGPFGWLCNSSVVFFVMFKFGFVLLVSV